MGTAIVHTVHSAFLLNFSLTLLSTIENIIMLYYTSLHDYHNSQNHSQSPILTTIVYGHPIINPLCDTTCMHIFGTYSSGELKQSCTGHTKEIKENKC